MTLGEDLAEIELPPKSLVIADLHLLPGESTSYEPFVAWLAALAGTPRLVILGDLFEYWIGPQQIRREGPCGVLDALAAAGAAGTAIDVVPGNRDFLLGAGFERASGCTVRRDGLVGRTEGGLRVLFLHGDELSTRDVGYQRLRRVLRSGPVRYLACRMPAWAGERVARRLRRASHRAVAAKPSAAMALQADACRRVALAHDAAVVVCGHAHSFSDERLAGGPRWVVLDAFGGERDTLEVGTGVELGLGAGLTARPG